MRYAQKVRERPTDGRDLVAVKSRRGWENRRRKKKYRSPGFTSPMAATPSIPWRLFSSFFFVPCALCLFFCRSFFPPYLPGVDSSRAAARTRYSVGRINTLKAGSTLFGVEKRKCPGDSPPFYTFTFFRSA